MNSFSIPARNLSAGGLIGKHISSLGLEDPILLAPDEGSLSLVERTSREADADCDYLVKERVSPEKVRIAPKELDVEGRDAVIIDDIVSTGGTAVEAAKILKEEGAREVHIGCIHAVLAEGALNRIEESGADGAFATDTIESEITEVSVAPLISGALRSAL